MRAGCGQRREGYALVEMLTVLGITGLILSSLVTAIYQTVAIPMAGSLKISALDNIRSAGRWLLQDIRMAGASSLPDGGPAQGSLTLTWNTYYTDGNFDPLNPVPHSSSYALSGTQLRRNFDGVISVVARDISSVQFSRQGDIVTFVITATPRGQSDAAERRTYNMYLEPKTDPVR